MTTIEIAAADAGDKAGWLPLWQAYLDFYRQPLPQEITDLTFARALDPQEPVFLMVAKAEGRVIGFATVILHRSTWARTHYVYLEDLYVAEEARGRGAAQALIASVIDIAKRNDCERVYWVTQEGNAAARVVYDKVAAKVDYVTYFAKT